MSSSMMQGIVVVERKFYPGISRASINEMLTDSAYDPFIKQREINATTCAYFCEPTTSGRRNSSIGALLFEKPHMLADNGRSTPSVSPLQLETALAVLRENRNLLQEFSPLKSHQSCSSFTPDAVCFATESIGQVIITEPTVVPKNHVNDGTLPKRGQFPLRNDKRTGFSTGSRSRINGGCKFCYKNGWPEYYSHQLKVAIGRRNIISCPILRAHICQLCGAYGDNAHTQSYCPLWIGGQPPAKKLTTGGHTAAGRLRTPLRHSPQSQQFA